MLDLLCDRLLNHKLISSAKLYLVSAFPDIVKDCPKMRNFPKIFLRSFENVAQIFKMAKVLKNACCC